MLMKNKQADFVLFFSKREPLSMRRKQKKWYLMFFQMILGITILFR